MTGYMTKQSTAPVPAPGARSGGQGRATGARSSPPPNIHLIVRTSRPGECGGSDRNDRSRSGGIPSMRHVTSLATKLVVGAVAVGSLAIGTAGLAGATTTTAPTTTPTTRRPRPRAATSTVPGPPRCSPGSKRTRPASRPELPRLTAREARAEKAGRTRRAAHLKKLITRFESPKVSARLHQGVGRDRGQVPRVGPHRSQRVDHHHELIHQGEHPPQGSQPPPHRSAEEPDDPSCHPCPVSGSPPRPQAWSWRPR